jgi:hypothetical protein
MTNLSQIGTLSAFLGACKSLIYSNLWGQKWGFGRTSNLLNCLIIRQLNLVPPPPVVDNQSVTASLSSLSRAIKNYQLKIKSRIGLCLFFKENAMRNVLIVMKFNIIYKNKLVVTKSF